MLNIIKELFYINQLVVIKIILYLCQIMARQINLSNKSMWVETTLLGELMRDYLQCKCSSRRNITRSRKETNNGYFHLSLRKSQKTCTCFIF